MSDDNNPGGFIGFFVFMTFLWKLIHRNKVVIAKTGQKVKIGDMEMEVKEGGFEDSEELEKLL